MKMRFLFLPALALVAAGVLYPVTAAANPIERACLQSGRAAASTAMLRPASGRRRPDADGRQMRDGARLRDSAAAQDVRQFSAAPRNRCGAPGATRREPPSHVPL